MDFDDERKAKRFEDTMTGLQRGQERMNDLME